MPRTANLQISQWFRSGRAFIEGWEHLANCRDRSDLPWTSDQRPDFHDQQEMAAVCSDCPVTAKCAARGLAAVGGFYAGVWIPWQTFTPDSDNTRAARVRGRRTLKNLVNKTA